MLNALISSQDMNMNIGISFEGNVSSIIRSWFHEILHFLPEVKTCMNRNKCRRFLTVNYFIPEPIYHFEVGICLQNRRAIYLSNVNFYTPKRKLS